ncbi:hypothetical protein Tco_0914069 [Tanacetum coccineum]
MMDADYELCKRFQEQEQGELTIEEKSKLFMELMNESKRHFAKLRTEEKRRKPLKRSKKESNKRAGNEQKQESSKRQRMKDDKETDEHEEAEEDDEAEMKKHMEIVEDKEEIVIDAIPLATKPPMIVEYKIVKERQKGLYHLIRADGSSKRNLKIQKMNIKFREGLLGFKYFKMILRVNTAQVDFLWREYNKGFKARLRHVVITTMIRKQRPKQVVRHQTEKLKHDGD